MRKERKDFPTTLKYKFYVLSQQFPQSFKIERAKLQSYLEPVNRQNFIQHIDKDESKIRQLQNLAISEVKPLPKNKTNAQNIDVDDLSMIREAKGLVDCLNKVKSCEQKAEKHEKKEQISLRDLSMDSDPNHRLKINIEKEQKKQAKTQVKNQVKKQKQFVNIKNEEPEKPKSLMQDEKKDGQVKPNLVQKIDDKQNQGSLIANKRNRINLEESSDDEQQQKKRKLREKAKQSTGRKLNQTAVSIAYKNESINLSLGEIGHEASNKNQKIEVALAKKQHDKKQTKAEDINILKQNDGKNIMKTGSQKEQFINKMPPFPLNQNNGIQYNKNQSKTSEMNLSESSVEQEILQNQSISEASSKIKQLQTLSNQNERELEVENLELRENRLLQSQVKHSKVENKFFQDEEQHEIQSFLPYMEQTEDKLQKQVSKDQQQRQIRGKSQFEKQFESNNNKQEQQKELEAEQSKNMLKISYMSQQNNINEVIVDDKMAKSASYEQQTKLCQNKNNYSMNQFNRTQKQNELRQWRKVSNCSSEEKSNKLVSRFLVDYQKQTGRNWIQSEINQQKNNLSSQNNCEAQNKDKQQMEQLLFNKFNTIIESLKNEVASSQDCIKKLSQRLETQQERLKQILAKNKDLEQSSMIYVERIEQLEKCKQEMTKQVEQNNKEIKEFKLQMQNYQKQSHIDKQLMRQKMDVMDVQLARLNIRLGDMLSVAASPKGVTKKNKQG